MFSSLELSKIEEFQKTVCEECEVIFNKEPPKQNSRYITYAHCMLPQDGNRRVYVWFVFDVASSSEVECRWEAVICHACVSDIFTTHDVLRRDETKDRIILSNPMDRFLLLIQNMDGLKWI